jgi:hypothetical protein
MWLWCKRPSAPSRTIRTEQVPCHDEDGHRAVLTVGLTEDGQITLTSPHGDTTVFELLEAGHLRSSLRSVIAGTNARR